MNDIDQINDLLKTKVKKLLLEYPQADSTYAIGLMRKFLYAEKGQLIGIHDEMKEERFLFSFSLSFFESAIKKDKLVRKFEIALEAEHLFCLGLAKKGKDSIKQIVLSEIGRKAVMAKLAKDPKQLALSEIEEIYFTKKNQFKRRGFTAGFVREMHSKYPVITEQKTIANLVAKLNKKNELIPR